MMEGREKEGRGKDRYLCEICEYVGQVLECRVWVVFPVNTCVEECEELV